MSKMTWHNAGDKTYETGISDVALFVKDAAAGTFGKGVAWNGVTSLEQKPTGAETIKLFADNIKYLELVSAEDFEFTIEAYSYPKEFDACIGYETLTNGISLSQQNRAQFALVYKTRVGNDAAGTDFGYKLHIIYNALASVSNVNYETIDDDPDAITMSWDGTTTPIPVDGHKPVAHIVIDSRNVKAGVLKQIEDSLYGTDSAEPTLLMPNDLVALSGN